VRVIDLHEGFVVPAFADAHVHSPSSSHDFVDANRALLDAGVFYVLNPGGNAEPANSIRGQLGTAATVDAIFAHALFTCSGGHPRPYLEYLVDRGDLPYSKDKLEGRFFNSVDSVTQVERVWPEYLATRPDFVKLVFVFSDFYATGKGKSLGLRPDVAKAIVGNAKLAGLRSGAHIESAMDFHNAVAVGVDAIMHLPSFPDPIDRQAEYANKADWTIVPFVKPSRTFHAVCAYWLMSSEGSSGKAHVQHRSSRAGRMVAGRHPRNANPNGLEPLAPTGFIGVTLTLVLRTLFYPPHHHGGQYYINLLWIPIKAKCRPVQPSDGRQSFAYGMNSLTE